MAEAAGRAEGPRAGTLQRRPHPAGHRRGQPAEPGRGVRDLRQRRHRTSPTTWSRRSATPTARCSTRPSRTKKRAVSDDIAGDVTFALSNVVENGTGRTVQTLDRPVAGKTGTNGVTGHQGQGHRQLGLVRRLHQADLHRGDVRRRRRRQRPAWTTTRGPGDSTFFGGTYPAQTWADYMETATKGQAGQGVRPARVRQPGEGAASRPRPAEPEPRTRRTEKTTRPRADRHRHAEPDADRSRRNRPRAAGDGKPPAPKPTATETGGGGPGGGR